MSTPDSQRHRRARSKARGLCAYCGSRPAVGGRVSCATCRQSLREATARYRARPKRTTGPAVF